MNAPRSSTLLLCSIVTLLAWPPLARAQASDPERPVDPSRAVRVQAAPRVDEHGRRQQRLQRAAPNPKRDFTFTAIPDLEVSVHPGRLRLAYNTGTELVYFHEYTSERSLNRNFGAPGRPRSHHPEAVCLLHLTPGPARGRIPKSTFAPSIGRRPTRPGRASSSRLAPRWCSPRASRATPTLTEKSFAVSSSRETLNEKTRAYDTAFNVALTPVHHRRRRGLEGRDAVRPVTAAELGHAPGRRRR